MCIYMCACVIFYKDESNDLYAIQKKKKNAYEKTCIFMLKLFSFVSKTVSILNKFKRQIIIKAS